MTKYVASIASSSNHVSNFQKNSTWKHIYQHFHVVKKISKH